ncbi:MAG: excisionase [Clostridiaceae bacterium]|nr:excisionase [Clostridiaceae bacterium]
MVGLDGDQRKMNKSTNMKIEEILQEILQTLRKSQPKATMTVLECSIYMNVSKEKIRELIHKVGSDFPFFRVGTKVLVNKVELDLWLKKISEEHRVL